MPFISARQEMYMMINTPGLWKEWVAKYGHHPGFKALIKKSNKKSPKRRNRKRKSRRKRRG